MVIKMNDEDTKKKIALEVAEDDLRTIRKIYRQLEKGTYQKITDGFIEHTAAKYDLKVPSFTLEGIGDFVNRLFGVVKYIRSAVTLSAQVKRKEFLAEYKKRQKDLMTAVNKMDGEIQTKKQVVYRNELLPLLIRGKISTNLRREYRHLINVSTMAYFNLPTSDLSEVILQITDAVRKLTQDRDAIDAEGFEKLSNDLSIAYKGIFEHIVKSLPKTHDEWIISEELLGNNYVTAKIVSGENGYSVKVTADGDIIDEHGGIRVLSRPEEDKSGIEIYALTKKEALDMLSFREDVLDEIESGIDKEFAPLDKFVHLVTEKVLDLGGFGTVGDKEGERRDELGHIINPFTDIAMCQLQIRADLFKISSAILRASDLLILDSIQ